MGLVKDMNVIIIIMVAQYLVFTALTIFIDTYKFKKFKNVKNKVPINSEQPIINDISGLFQFFDLI